MSLADQSQQWVPTSVQVTVLQARSLRIKGKNGTNDAYAIMQVAKDKFSTSVVEKSAAPVWKEEAIFDLPLFHQDTTERSTLHVYVMHRALVGPDKVLGQAIINLPELYENKTRDKTEWFRLVDKTGKADKERGEVQLDVQFLKNNMTASMFDLSSPGKPRSRIGKLKDKLRGRKKEGLSDSASAIVPSTQAMTDSEGEGEEEATSPSKAKKNTLKTLFSSKTNLQRNTSQSLSTLSSLPEKDSAPSSTLGSALSSSRGSALDVEPAEGKKKFKFLTHKRSGSSDGKLTQSGSGNHPPVTICINGSHVYSEEAEPSSRVGRASEDLHRTQGKTGLGPPEDLRPPTHGRQAEEQREMEEEKRRKTAEEERVRVEREMEERKRKEEEQRRKIEEEKEKKRVEKMKEEQREKEENEKWVEQEKRKRAEEKRMREEEEKRAEEKRMREEEKKRAEEKRMREEEKKRAEEKRMREEEEKRAEEKRMREEEEKRAEEKRMREEEEKRAEEKRMREEEERKRAEEKRMREEEERKRAEEKRMREEEERKRAEAQLREEERKRKEEEEMKREQEKEKRLKAERLREEERRVVEEKEKQRKEEEKRAREEDERTKAERKRKEEEDAIREQQRNRNEWLQVEEERRRGAGSEEKNRGGEEQAECGEHAWPEGPEERQKTSRPVPKTRLAKAAAPGRPGGIQTPLGTATSTNPFEETLSANVPSTNPFEDAPSEEAPSTNPFEEPPGPSLSASPARSARVTAVRPRTSASGFGTQMPLVHTNPFVDDHSSENLSSADGAPDRMHKKGPAPLPPHKQTQEPATAVSSRGFSGTVLEGTKPRSSCRDMPKCPAPSPPDRSKKPREEAAEVPTVQSVIATGQGQKNLPEIPEKHRPVELASASGGELTNGQDQTRKTQADVEPFRGAAPAVAQHNKGPAPAKPSALDSPSRRSGSQDKQSRQTLDSLHHEKLPSASSHFDSDEDPSIQKVVGDKCVLRAGELSSNVCAVGCIQSDLGNELSGNKREGEHVEKMAAPDSVNPKSPSHIDQHMGSHLDEKETLTQASKQKSHAPLPPAKPKRVGDTSLRNLPLSLLHEAEHDHAAQDKEAGSTVGAPRGSLPPPTPSSSSGVTPPAGTSLLAKPCAGMPEGWRSESGMKPLPWARGMSAEGQLDRGMCSSSGGGGGGAGQIPASAVRPHAVKPLSAVDRQPDRREACEPRVAGGADPKQAKTQQAAEAKGPYAQLTHGELVAMVMRQQEQLSQRDGRIQELEQYIDNLLARVMEEKPSILMAMSSQKKAV